MQAYDRTNYGPQPSQSGVGCAFLGPIAVLGSIVLAEEHSHAGDEYFLAELVGWWTLCIGVGLSCGVLFDRQRSTHGGYRASLYLAAVTLAFIVPIFAVWQPGTPLWIKHAFIIALKTIGFLVLPVIAGYVFWRRWSARRG